MKVKKMLAVTLATTMLMMSSMTAFAADGSGGSDSPASSVKPSVSTSSAGAETSASVEGESAPSISLADVFSANTVMNIGGNSVATSVAGAYAAKSVNGAAVIAPISEVRANLGLSGGQVPYIIVFDTDVKGSYQAMACLNAATTAMGGTMITALNIELGAKQGGKFVSLNNGSVGFVVGLSKAAIDPVKTYSVICVRPGGAITIYADQDTNPNTVTFPVCAGLGTYAIVAK